MSLRLVIFDVDGTLVDSQADILGAMTVAFAAQDLPMPPREAVLGIVGLSLPEAFLKLVPQVDAAGRAALVEGYKSAFATRRHTAAHFAPLYPGAREALSVLHARDEVLLGVATGKSRRGLRAVVEAHGLEQTFVTTQVADDHPSKPHPSMLMGALAETGVDAQDAVMIGDTVYDMEMAQAAGIPFIGVSWGYHPAAHLTGSHAILDSFVQLPAVLDAHWGATA